MGVFLKGTGVPVLGFSGNSNSGKTTLLEKLATRLNNRGLKIGYLKHDAHAFQMDKEGKDTYRMFQAGVHALVINSSAEHAARVRHGGLSANAVFADCDILLVEGYKEASWSKVWVHPHSGGRDYLPQFKGIVGEVGVGLHFDHDNVDLLTDFVLDWLRRKMKEKPVYGGILIGGRSRRMGRPKSMLKHGNVTLSEKQYELLKKCCQKVYLLGTGILPEALLGVERLADPPEVKGPLAGFISATRMRLGADWIILALDIPNVNLLYLERLLARRSPGFGGVVPKNPENGHLEPLCALYSSQLLASMEQNFEKELSVKRLLAKLGVEGDEDIYDPIVLKNANTPEDLS